MMMRIYDRMMPSASEEQLASSIERPTGSLSESPPLPVSVDRNFVRTMADHTLVMPLGRDIDIAFLAFGSKVESVEGLNDESRESAAVHLRPQLNEVARVRLAPAQAVTMAMQILQDATERGRLNVAGVVEQISSWTSGEAAEITGNQKQL